MKSLGYQIKYQIKHFLNQYKQIIAKMLFCLGLIISFAEIINIFFNSTKIYDFLHQYNWGVILFLLVIALYSNRFKFRKEFAITKTDTKIIISLTDIFRSSNAIIIPTNSTFDTKMEDEFISVNSVQGQFQKKYFNNNLSSLDILIAKGLENKEFIALNRTKSKNKQYPIGTVSKITHVDSHFYFVAIADVNENGKPKRQNFQNIQLALEGIWQELDENGHIEDISIPLLGTGRAGIKDANRNKVIKEIVFSFIASSKEKKVTECLNICIHPADLKSNSLQLNEIMEYLYYMCNFKYSESNSKNNGTKI